MKNRWQTNSKFYASWTANFSLVSSESYLDNLVRFACKLLETGEDTQIFQVRFASFRNGDVFRVEEGKSFAVHNMDVASKTGQLPLFDLHRSRGGNELKTASLVYYYDGQGKRVAEYIENVGSLVRRFSSEEDQRYYERSMLEGVAPMTITGSYFSPNGNETLSTASISLRIEIYTDIWFRWVTGYGIYNFHPNNKRRMWSNLNLAKKHTPRFNRFIETVRQLTLDIGGTWSVYRTDNRYYQDMIKETGILLDV